MLQFFLLFHCGFKTWNVHMMFSSLLIHLKIPKVATIAIDTTPMKTCFNSFYPSVFLKLMFRWLKAILREKKFEKKKFFFSFFCEGLTLTLFLVFYILWSFKVLIKLVFTKESVISVEFTLLSNIILIDLIILKCK